MVWPRGWGGKRGVAEGAVGRGSWWAEGVGGQRGPVGRGSDRSEGAQRPFGCGRSEPSCSGPGSAERSAAERGPNSSFYIFAHPLQQTCPLLTT